MSNDYDGKKQWTLLVFTLGILFGVLGVVLTVIAIWLMGGHTHHGISAKLGSTAAVSYILGIICTCVGGANRWDWS